jgi:sugar phosphate isomerase/epimerase
MPAPQPTPLTLGIGEWGFRNRPIAEWIDLATRLGFKHLEFGIGGGWPGRLPDAPTPADVAAFNRLAASRGVTTRYCCLENDFTRPDASEHAAQLRTTLAQLAPAADCGAKAVRLFAGFTPAEQVTDEIYGRMMDGLYQCAKAAAKLGTTIAIETHGAISANADGSLAHRHTVTTRRDWIVRLLEELPEGVDFNYDPGNLKAADPDDQRYAADLLAGRVTYCHLKDWKRKGMGWTACAPGDDDIDYGKLLPVRGYDGVYLIEYEPLEDTEDGIKRSLAYLRRVLPGATL